MGVGVGLLVGVGVFVGVGMIEGVADGLIGAVVVGVKYFERGVGTGIDGTLSLDAEKTFGVLLLVCEFETKVDQATITIITTIIPTVMKRPAM